MLQECQINWYNLETAIKSFEKNEEEEGEFYFGFGAVQDFPRENLKEFEAILDNFHSLDKSDRCSQPKMFKKPVIHKKPNTRKRKHEKVSKVKTTNPKKSNETKNIPKNYGKQMIKFTLLNNELVK